MEPKDDSFATDPLPDPLPSVERDPEALVGIARGVMVGAQLVSNMSSQRHEKPCPPDVLFHPA